MAASWSGSTRKERLPDDREQRRTTTRDREGEGCQATCATAHAVSGLALTATTSSTVTTTPSPTCSHYAVDTTTRRAHSKRSKRAATSHAHQHASHKRTLRPSIGATPKGPTNRTRERLPAT